MPPSVATAGRKAGGGGARNKAATAAVAGGEQGAAVTRSSRRQQQQQQQLDVDDDETNAGFGKYLRSQEGIEMMKLFVIANTLVVFMTMAWPQMQQSYQMLRSIFYGEADGEDTTYP
ncbi:uncharacterized protein LOC131214091 [Anopheles bellator]|uniref:uncharacterized protein LOC131214091 n=1 Tax=Anopheles bellator TaxID=139047 RepID=UPI002649CD02|nr:uncharacterized protein LOC131214091 [Anopheles bellator]